MVKFVYELVELCGTCGLYSLSSSPTPRFGSFFRTSHSSAAISLPTARPKPPRAFSRSRSFSSHAYVRKVSLFYLLVTSMNLVDWYRKSFFNPAMSSSLTAVVAVATPVVSSTTAGIKPTSMTCFHQSRTGSGLWTNI